MRKLMWIAIAALIASPALAGMAQVNRTVSIGPDGTVDLEIIAGTVEINGWDGSDVQIDISYDDRYLKVDIVESGRGVSIEIEPLKDEEDHIHGRDLDDTVVRLQVPRGARLDIESVAADTTIEDVSGTVDVEIVSGNLILTGGDLQGSVSAVSGDVRIDAEMLGDGDFESVSGDVVVRGQLAPAARLSFESVSGDVELHLPASASAEFEIETFSGNISNDFGPEAEKTSDFLPSKQLRFTLGSGDARISAETLSGQVKLVRD